ncbi:uncharacterized protein [Macrobrachium rosenbergii]|uniref:uncharacterized protein n=1 Tax=Macrobrachium rosenbergii TaxID=79674 RepID=UPI0034D4453F
MINLTCVLHNLPEPPAYVLWYHNNKSISYSSSRGGVSIIVEKGPTTISYLLITSAMDMDAGVYTCAPSNYNATSVNLHILQGEEPSPIRKKNSIPSKEKAASQGEFPTAMHSETSGTIPSVGEANLLFLLTPALRIFWLFCIEDT